MTGPKNQPTEEPAAPKLPQTAAPWAKHARTEDVLTAPLPVRPGHTGRPTAALIPAEPALPRNSHDGSTGPSRTFRAPEAPINSEVELKQFLKSDTVKSFVSFILALNESVKGKALSHPCHVSAAVKSMIDVLSQLSTWVDDIPASQQPLRYGNPAFRQWHARVLQASPELLQGLLPDALLPAAVELAPYLQNSFGNATRIDYGTGHEMNFCALLYCLVATGVFDAGDSQALVTRIFSAYLALMRKIQTTYWLEPAGSRGVWGLDDYQFLPFIWGSAQLSGHPSLKPSSIHAAKVLTDFSEDYLYIACVKFVREVKKGPLQETSPLLNDISAIPRWEKVNSGMVKMYEAEVLAKFPIMQHFLCGSILPFGGAA